MKSNIVSSRPSDLRGNNAVQALRDGRCDRCCVEIVFSFCFVALDFPPALVSGEPRERRVVQTAGNEHHPVKQGDRLTSHLIIIGGALYAIRPFYPPNAGEKLK